MHSLLTKWLAKNNIKSPEELNDKRGADGTPSERELFNSYKQVLGKERLDIDDIKGFCENQVSLIESKWRDYSLKEAKKAELIPYHTVYKAILSAIDGPKQARESLEKYLNQLTN